MGKRTFIKKLLVRLRLLYAKIRGLKGKKWNYEPSDRYMGRFNNKN